MPYFSKRFVFTVSILLLFIWTVIRAFEHYSPTELSTNYFRYRFFLGSVTLLTICWSLVSIVLLVRWKTAEHLLDGLLRSRYGRWLIWLLPAGLWLISFTLYEVGKPLPFSTRETPSIVLVVIGVLCLAFLLKRNDAFSNVGVEAAESETINGKLEVLDPGQNNNVSTTSWKTKLAIFFALSVTILILFRDALFDNSIVVFGYDLFALHYPFEKYVREAFSMGHLPLWNPYIFSGNPALSHPQYLTFYPPQILLRLLPINLSITWAAAIHIWIAGIGMYVLCRRFGLDVWIALASAISYMLNGGMLLRLTAGAVWLVFVIALFPFVWLITMVALRSKRPIFTIVSGFMLALVILTGHPTFPAYLIIFLGLYSFFVFWQEWQITSSLRKAITVILKFTIIVLFAVGFSAVQIVPTLVLQSQVSLSGGYNLDAAGSYNLKVSDLLAFIVPYFYPGRVTAGSLWELIPYHGPLPLLFSFLALTASVSFWGKRFRIFLVGICLFVLILSFGDALGLFTFLYAAFPPFRLLRIPSRSFLLWLPSIVILAGFGLKAVSERRVKLKWLNLSKRVYFILALVLLGVAGGLWLEPSVININNGAVNPIVRALQIANIVIIPILVILMGSRGYLTQNLGVSSILGFCLLFLIGVSIGLLSPINEEILRSRLWYVTEDVLRTWLIYAGILLIVSGHLLSNLYKYGLSTFAIVPIIGFIFLDLFAVNGRLLRFEQPPTFYSEERILFNSATPSELGRIYENLDFDVVPSKNQYIHGHMNNVDGYNSGVLAEYDRFLSFVTSVEDIRPTSLLGVGAIVDSKVLNFLGVEYLLSVNNLEGETYVLEASNEDFRLYRNPSPLPRAFMVYDFVLAESVDEALIEVSNPNFDYATNVILYDRQEINIGAKGNGKVSIVDHVPYNGNLSMLIETTEPGVLVLSDPYYSERRAFLNSEEVPTMLANVGFTAVSVPEGTHNVEFRYVPTSLYIGTGITIVTFLISIMIIIYGLTERKRDSKQLANNSLGKGNFSTVQLFNK